MESIRRIFVMTGVLLLYGLSKSPGSKYYVVPTPLPDPIPPPNPIPLPDPIPLPKPIPLPDPIPLPKPVPGNTFPHNPHTDARDDRTEQSLKSILNLLQRLHEINSNSKLLSLAIEVLAFAFSTIFLQWVGACCNRRSDNSKEIKDALVQFSVQLGHLNQAIARQGSDAPARNNKNSNNQEARKSASINEGFKIIYRFSDECEHALKEDISKYLKDALKDSDVTLEGSQLPQESALLLYFDLVDDRIRSVEQKRQEAASLLEETDNNCVWSFVCFKPNPEAEATKIQNSIAGFPSGYTTKDGKFHQTYLTFEYCVESNEKDKHGNFKHLLVDKDKFITKIASLIQQARTQ